MRSQRNVCNLFIYFLFSVRREMKRKKESVKIEKRNATHTENSIFFHERDLEEKLDILEWTQNRSANLWIDDARALARE